MGLRWVWPGHDGPEVGVARGVMELGWVWPGV